MAVTPPLPSDLPAAVRQALDRIGLVLVQGQKELPSLADLLAGHPVTTKGYSWDYVPAWTLAHELDQHPDFAEAKLWRGLRTIVSRCHWPALESLARGARIRIHQEPGVALSRELLALIESDPGITGKQIQTTLGWDSKTFQKHKRLLEERLLILGRDQESPESHTHDHAWHPWSSGKIAQVKESRNHLPDVAEAATSLLAAAGMGDVSARERGKLLPVAAWLLR